MPLLKLLGRQAMMELGLTNLAHWAFHIARGGTQEALCATVDHGIASWFIAEGLQTIVRGVSKFI